MNILASFSDQHRRYNAELRLFIVSTSWETAPERSALMSDVLPEFRRRSGERGVIVIDTDPRWEIASEPEKAQEIFAAHLNEMHAYRPVFIGILGDGAGPGGGSAEPSLPWLADRSDPEVRLMAMDFIERVLDNELMQGRAFFYILDEPEPPTAAGEPETWRRLGELKARLRGSGFPVREGIGGTEALCEHIQRDLLSVLDRLHPAGGALTPLEQTRRPHELFAARLRRVYEDIPSYFDRLDAHVDGGPPLMITGRSGDGKSALLANWIEDHRGAHPSVPIICHHIGAASVRSDHGAVLRHVMAELKSCCAISSPLPETTEELTEAFPEWLAQVGHERLVLIIDGLDGLDPASQDLAWLPEEVGIPENIRLIVSTSHEGETGRAIHHLLIDRDWEELRVEPLTIRQQQAIISRFVAESGADIGAELLKSFDLGGDTSSPLFIRMGAGQIRNSGNDQERSELLSARTGEEFLDTMFYQLEEKFGSTFMRDVMSLLWGARGGLLAGELRQLVGNDADRIDDLLDSADHYLMEQDGLWTFIHKRIRQTVERRYLPTPAARKGVHRGLARYFAAGPVTPRRAGEEPWQWEQGGSRAELAACLCGIDMFMCMSREDHRHELRGYWVRLDDEQLLVECYGRSFEQWRAGGEVRDDEQAVVAERLGAFFHASGLLAMAERYLRLALALFGTSRGEHELETAHAMHSAAELLRGTGEFVEAEKLYGDALAILERRLAPDDPAIAQLLNDMGLLYRDAGQHAKALPFYQRALDMKEHIHGADHPATAELLNDLALLYQDLHDFARAIPLYERALGIRERRLGPMHPAVSTTLNNLAGTLRANGDLDAAESYYVRSLDIAEKMLGRNHPSTRVTVNNLASLFQQQKKFDEARAMFERLLNETWLDEDHPDMIRLNIAYAQLLTVSGDYRSAESILGRTLETAIRRLGPVHPDTAACYNNFANLLRWMGREQEAGPFLEGAIEGWRTSLGPDHPTISGALQTLAIIRLKGGDPEKARRMLNEAIAIREKHFGLDHQKTLETRSLLKRVDADEG